MAGEAAITKVKTRLKDWLTGEIGADVDLDRPFNSAYSDEELATPQVNIRFARVDFDLRGYNGGWLHSGSVMFDIVTRSATVQTIDERQAEVIAAIVGRMAEITGDDTGQIGELLQLHEPVAVAQPEDDINLADYGSTTLAYRLIWVTPQNDFKTIVSATGALIP